MEQPAGSSKLLIYFHGNAEDVGIAIELLDYLRTLLRVSLLYKSHQFRYIFWLLNIQVMESIKNSQHQHNGY